MSQIFELGSFDNNQQVPENGDWNYQNTDGDSAIESQMQYDQMSMCSYETMRGGMLGDAANAVGNAVNAADKLIGENGRDRYISFGGMAAGAAAAAIAFPPLAGVAGVVSATAAILAWMTKGTSPVNYP